MTRRRRTRWFATVAVAMAVLMGVLASVQGVAQAGVIPSSASGGASRAEDLAKVQAFLENRIVAQRLVDYGVAPAEALAKVQGLSPQELHRLASLSDRAAAGADSGIGLLISLAVLVILVIVILKLLDKEIVIR